MSCRLSDEMIHRFDRDDAQALPDMNKFLYDDPDAFKGKISTRCYGELAKIPQMVASKYRQRAGRSDGRQPRSRPLRRSRGRSNCCLMTGTGIMRPGAFPRGDRRLLVERSGGGPRAGHGPPTGGQRAPTGRWPETNY